jgi:predicted transcriptional regulator
MKTVAQLLKLKDQKNQEVHQINPDHMVLEALMKMAEKNVGALLVVEDEKWSASSASAITPVSWCCMGALR